LSPKQFATKLVMGKYLVPGTPLGGEHTAAEIRQIVTDLH
jgi:hypothetical protein